MKCCRCVLDIVRRCLNIVFPFLDTMKSKCFRTSDVKLAEASAVSQTLSRRSPSPLAAAATFTRLSDLYKRVECSGWRADGQCSSQFPRRQHRDSKPDDTVTIPVNTHLLCHAQGACFGLCRSPAHVKHLFPTSVSIILFCSPLIHLSSSPLRCFPSLLRSTSSVPLPPFLSLSLSVRPPDQGEAICGGNPSLILAQRSWKMYSRQTVGRCRLVLGPQQVPGSALMEHYFHPHAVPSSPYMPAPSLSLSLRLSGLFFFSHHTV